MAERKNDIELNAGETDLYNVIMCCESSEYCPFEIGWKGSICGAFCALNYHTSENERINSNRKGETDAECEN